MIKAGHLIANAQNQRVVAKIAFFALLPLFSTMLRAQSKVSVDLSSNATQIEKIAAGELISKLHVLYPSTEFQLGPLKEASTSILLGTTRDLPKDIVDRLSKLQSGPESFAVEAFNKGKHPIAIIAGASPRATQYAVYSLLEKLGFGFYLSYDTSPSANQDVFNFKGWELHDTPLVGTRTIFEWHNFLSGCSTWNLGEWQQWIDQAARLRFNTIMVHAYGNNPMFTFTYNGVTKATGYLASTDKGRDWGTEHVVDVRKMVGADGLFDSAVFGADASKVPDTETVSSATHLMQSVFQFAVKRGMNITFALDVDTESANPQNIIGTLPASARFTSQGLQLANPDTPEGYAYYRSQVDQLLKLYPEITEVALWFRGGLASPWRSLKTEEFPDAWRGEFKKELERDPSLKNDPEAPGIFAVAKIAKAFRKALNETKHSNVTLAAGSWQFTFLPSADAFMPAGTVLMPLDYSYEFPSDPVQEGIRKVARHRPVQPIIWAQHDDREYAGRSYTPFAGLGSLLRWSNSSGYGVIHWTTRPLDLYFKNITDQVWSSSQNESLDTTASIFAKKTFGLQAQDLGKQYLLDWIYDAPAFGRATSNRFIDQTLDMQNETPGAKRRLQLLKEMEPLAQGGETAEWVQYFQDWERYAQSFYEAQNALQLSQDAMKKGNMDLARKEIANASPESVIEEYARAIRHQDTSLGEKGILVSLNLKWLPYFAAQRQALGLEPLRFEFRPTVNESLAQGPGRYSFDFDSLHRVIGVLGSDETGATVYPRTLSTGCDSGLQLRSPVPLVLSGLSGTSLQPGNYELTLDLPPGSKVLVDSNGTHNQTLTAGSSVRVSASSGRIRITLSPAADATSVCGLALKKMR